MGNHQTLANKMDKFIQNGDFIGFDAFESINAFDVILADNFESFSVLWKNESLQFLKCIILSKKMSNQKKCGILWKLLKVEIPSNFEETLNSLKQEMKNKKLLDSFSAIFKDLNTK